MVVEESSSLLVSIGGSIDDDDVGDETEMGLADSKGISTLLFTLSLSIVTGCLGEANKLFVVDIETPLFFF